MVKQGVIDLERLLTGDLLEEKRFMFDVDPQKAFQKLSEKQFSNPFHAYRELVANALDSYIGTGNKREVDMRLDGVSFSIRDYGTGMGEKKMHMLRTLGLTDKKSKDYVGRFGIGFASLFHPGLDVQCVTIDTSCDGARHLMVFERSARGLTYKRYDGGKNLKSGTHVHVKFDSPSTARVNNIKLAIFDSCGYLRADVTLNGREIPKKILTEAYPYRRTINVKGLEGFIGLGTTTSREHSKISVCSHGFHVQNILRLSYSNFEFSPLEGVVNYDRFNIVSSRNQISHDSAFYRFWDLLGREASAFFGQLAKQYKNMPTPDLKNTLNNLLYGNLHFLMESICGVRKKPLRMNDLLTCKLFDDISLRNQFSLDDLRKVYQRQGHLMMASRTSDLSLLEEVGYRGILLNKDKPGELNLLAYVGQYARSYGNRFHIYDVDDLEFGNPLFEKLVKRKVIDSRKIDRSYVLVSEDHLTEQQSSFIAQVKKLMKSREVKRVLLKHGIPRGIPLHFGKSNPRTIARYSSRDGIIINLQSDAISDLIGSFSTSPRLAVGLFLPILSHELTHDAIHSHDNPFYNLRGWLNKDLNEAIARSYL